MNAIHSQQALDPGTMVQEYRVDRVLGMGSLGIVYSAENTYFNEVVALKEFLPSNLACRKGTTVAPLSSEAQPSYDWALKKFLDEARTLRELCHPKAHRNIVRVRQFIEQNETAYMVMDYEKGRPLSDLLKERKVLPEAELKEILIPLLDGLERIHAANIWHRDIKPSNILIRPDNSPVLIDFGAARHEMVGRDPSVMSQYTPGYAAIEQFHDAAKQGPWTDIFALGGTLYRAVTGRKAAKAIERFVDERVYIPASKASRGHYSATLLAAIDAALALKPEDRPQSIADWRRWFDGEVSIALVGDAATASTGPTTGAPLDATMVLPGSGAKKQEALPAAGRASRSLGKENRKTRRLPVAAALSVLLAAMVIAAVGTVLYQRRTPVPVTDPVPKPNVQPVNKPDLPAIRSRVTGLLTGLECASVRSRLADDGTLSLDGFVSKREDLTRIRSEINKIAANAKVQSDLSVQPWPFCEILSILQPLQPAALPPGARPRLQLNNPDQRYRTGEKLVVTAAMGSAFEGYLYVDYIDSDGSVVHLLPSPRQTQNRVLPGQKRVLGALDATDASGDFVYEIQPPLGPGMVVAFASRQRLWKAPRPHVESIGEYMPVLQTALGSPQEQLVSTHTAIEIFE
ncbi:MAG: serine/threonine-protein kinase [Candidatus Thiodiazotropha sp.]